MVSASIGPPTKIFLKPVDSTGVTIGWFSPVLHRRDGIIISYQLCYSTQRLRSTCSSKGNVSYIEAENRFVQLEELLPATFYYFKVRAKTSTGPGNYTKEYKIITNSGEMLYLVSY